MAGPLATPSTARTLGALSACRIEPATLADVWRDLREIAGALGVPERGVQLYTRMRHRLRAISDRAGSLPPRRVAILEAATPLRAAGRWLPELLAMLGATDVLSEPGVAPVTIAFAKLAAADPDAIFLAPRDPGFARERKDLLPAAAQGRWRKLRAAREDRLFLADGAGTFHVGGPPMAATLEVLAEALHPAAFRFGHEGRLWRRWRP